MDRPNLIPVTARAGTPKFVITQRFDAAAVRDRHAATVDDLVARLHGPSDGDRIPVVIDASSCAHAALEGGVKLQGADRERRESLDLVDVTTFARDTLLPRREKKDFAVAGARLKIGKKMPTSLPPDALDGLIRHPDRACNNPRGTTCSRRRT
jgi:hypothetical protein